MIVGLRFARDQLRSARWWLVGVVALVGVSVGVYPSVKGQTGFDDSIEELPEFIKTISGFRADPTFSSPPGYWNSRVFALLVPLVLVIYAIGLGARSIGGAEDDGTLEQLLTEPVGRLRVATERALAVAVLVAGLGLVTLVLLVAAAVPVGLLDDGVTAADVAFATASTVALALLHAALAFAAGAVTGRRSPGLATGAALAVGGYLIHGLAAITSGLAWTRAVNPWSWYLERIVIVDGPDLRGTVLPLALAVLAVALATRRFDRRDLR